MAFGDDDFSVIAPVTTPAPEPTWPKIGKVSKLGASSFGTLSGSLPGATSPVASTEAPPNQYVPGSQSEVEIEETIPGGEAAAAEEVSYGGATAAAEEVSYGGATAAAEEVSYGGATAAAEDSSYGGEAAAAGDASYGGETAVAGDANMDGYASGTEAEAEVEGTIPTNYDQPGRGYTEAMGRLQEAESMLHYEKIQNETLKHWLIVTGVAAGVGALVLAGVLFFGKKKPRRRRRKR